MTWTYSPGKVGEKTHTQIMATEDTPLAQHKIQVFESRAE